jgi:hypothetical protein
MEKAVISRSHGSSNYNLPKFTSADPLHQIQPNGVSIHSFTKKKEPEYWFI